MGYWPNIKADRNPVFWRNRWNSNWQTDESWPPSLLARDKLDVATDTSSKARNCSSTLRNWIRRRNIKFVSVKKLSSSIDEQSETERRSVLSSNNRIFLEMDLSIQNVRCRRRKPS